MEERYINPYTDFGFRKLFEQAEIARYSPHDRMAYEESLKVYRDLRNVVSTAERKGLAQGLERGRAEGEHTKAVAIARQLKAMGMQHCDIASATGLSLEEITSLE